MFREFIVHLFGIDGYYALLALFYLYPIWLTLILAFTFWYAWMKYIRYLFFSSQKYVLLEVRLPKDIFKTPLAMETFLMSLYQVGGEGNLVDRYWDGKTRPWFSLELVSEGGQVRFLIWTREGMRNMIETQIYGQYPGTEVHQVDDYIIPIKFDPEKNNMWACVFELAQPNPLPIKTYTDYGLDKSQKEEEKIDPLSSTLEYLSSIGPDDNVYIQIVIRAHKKEKRMGFFSNAEDWTGEIKSLREEFLKRVDEAGNRRMNPDEQKIYDALTRRSQKYAFDCGIRCIYFANDKDKYNGAITGGIMGLLRPFSAAFPEDVKKEKGRFYAAFNGFKPEKRTDPGFSWSDVPVVSALSLSPEKNKKLNKNKRKMLDAYKRRMFFYDPYQEKTMILTTEELATIYHFPGSTAAAPGLERIPSKRGQAPTNLPI